MMDHNMGTFFLIKRYLAIGNIFLDMFEPQAVGRPYKFRCRVVDENSCLGM
jgi:hypothetical protein